MKSAIIAHHKHTTKDLNLYELYRFLAFPQEQYQNYENLRLRNIFYKKSQELRISPEI